MFVLVRTSNPGAADVEDCLLEGGERLWERLARLVDELGGGAAGELSDVGAVLGATEPGHLARARELMPRAVFLLPGVGAQGGRVEDLAPAFAPARAGGARDGVALDRRTPTRQPGESRRAAAAAEAERLREAAWSLASAT